MSYTTNETALKDLIVANLSGYSDNNTKCGETDQAFAYAIQNSTPACVLDYAGGRTDEQKPVFGAVLNWYWNTLISFFLPYNEETIETDIRALAQNFLNLWRDNKRLSTSCVWKVQNVGPAETYKRSERLFIVLSFMVAVKEDP